MYAVELDCNADRSVSGIAHTLPTVCICVGLPTQGLSRTDLNPAQQTVKVILTLMLGFWAMSLKHLDNTS